MNDFIERNLGNYIYSVEFIGQPGYYANENESTNDIQGNEEEEEGCYWSNQCEGALANKSFSDIVATNIRKWMENIRNYITRDYFILKNDEKIYVDEDSSNKQLNISVPTKNSEVKRLPNEPHNGYISLSDLNFGKHVKDINDDTEMSFQVADIYPAQKVLMMVYVLLGYLPNYIQENVGSGKDTDILIQEYFKMIASYVLNAFFFNSKNAVNMILPWNNLLSNACVYIYKNINGQNLITTDIHFGIMESMLIDLMVSDAKSPKYSPSFTFNLNRRLTQNKISLQYFSENRDKIHQFFRIYSEEQFPTVKIMSTIFSRLEVIGNDDLLNKCILPGNCLESLENIDSVLLIIELLNKNISVEHQSDIQHIEEIRRELLSSRKKINTYLSKFVPLINNTKKKLGSIIQLFIELNEEKGINEWYKNEFRILFSDLGSLLRGDHDNDNDNIIEKYNVIACNLLTSDDIDINGNPINLIEIIKTFPLHENKKMETLLNNMADTYNQMVINGRIYNMINSGVYYLMIQFIKDLVSNNLTFLSNKINLFKSGIDKINTTHRKQPKKISCSDYSDPEVVLEYFHNLSIYYMETLKENISDVEETYNENKKLLNDVGNSCIIKHDLINDSFKILKVHKHYNYYNCSIRNEIINPYIGKVVESLVILKTEHLKFKLISNDTIEFIDPPKINGFSMFKPTDNSSICLINDNEGYFCRILSNRGLHNELFYKNDYDDIPCEIKIPSSDYVLNNMVLTELKMFNDCENECSEEIIISREFQMLIAHNMFSEQSIPNQYKVDLSKNDYFGKPNTPPRFLLDTSDSIQFGRQFKNPQQRGTSKGFLVGRQFKNPQQPGTSSRIHLAKLNLNADQQRMKNTFFEVLDKTDTPDIRAFKMKHNQNGDNEFSNDKTFDTCLIFCFLYLHILGFTFTNNTIDELFANHTDRGNYLSSITSCSQIGRVNTNLYLIDYSTANEGTTFGSYNLQTVEGFMGDHSEFFNDPDSAIIFQIVNPELTVLVEGGVPRETGTHYVLFHYDTIHDPQQDQLEQNKKYLVLEWRVIKKTDK